jgi:hypothetical protein
MPWLKRNLVIVIGGLVGLGLLGLAGYYLYTKIQENEAVTAKLGDTTTELKTLVNRDPHPGTEQVNNIAAAKEEVVKLKGFLGKVKSHFSPPPPTNQMSSREFRELLDRRISEMRRRAEIAGVQIETNYWFTFKAHQNAVNFATNHVGVLATQLADIKSICDILFEAKILKLAGLKRLPVTSEDSGTTDYVTTKATTNNWAVITPYEVTFDSFSAELASVLAGLLRSRESFVVKNITVEKTTDAAAHEQEQQSTQPMMNPYGDRYGGLMRNRYGRGRYGEGGMPQQPVAQPPKPRGWENVLDEKNLRVTLQLDSVRLKAR